MACDQQATTPQGSKFKIKTKIFKFPPHPLMYPKGEFLVGFAGNVNEWMEAADWLQNPENYGKPPSIRDMSGLVLTCKKEIFLFSKVTNWLKIETGFHSIGSGSSFALGALTNGASPSEAIRTAMKHDIGSGLGVKTLGFK